MVLNMNDDPLSPVKYGCEVTVDIITNNVKDSVQSQQSEDKVEFCELSTGVCLNKYELGRFREMEVQVLLLI